MAAMVEQLRLVAHLVHHSLPAMTRCHRAVYDALLGTGSVAGSGI